MDPVGWVDPLGLRFEICPTCSAADQVAINDNLKQVESALKYNATKQKTLSAQAAYNDFMALKNDPSHVVTINATTGGNFYYPGTQIIEFNLIKKTGGVNGYGSNIRKPCIGLGHEIGHAIDEHKGTFSMGPSSDPAKFPNSAEEFAVGFENMARSGIWADPKMQRPKY
jgi:hypothetical protein